MQIAGYTIRLLQVSHFWLDGGGMFGVVPRTMWQDRCQPDGQNRIRLACNCLLLDGHGRRVLIETGCGDKWDAKEAEIYGIEDRGGKGSLVAALLGMAGGIEPASIDAVLCSHLHFDHGGGLTTLGPGAAGTVRKPVPSFPNARLFVQRREWDDAISNRSHMRTTYRPENIQPLADAGLVQLLDGPAEVLPNIRVEPAPGHTPGSQAIFVGEGAGAPNRDTLPSGGGPGEGVQSRLGTPAEGSQNETLCFVGDVIATRHHLRPFWTMAYDLDPMTVNQTRSQLVGRAIGCPARWIMVFSHDPEHPAGRVRLDEKGRWAFEAVTI